MLVLRGTKKLRDRVKAPMAVEGDASTTVLGDWFATALFWKPQLALLVNQRTFVPVFLPLAPAATLLDRIPDAIAATLRAHGADDSFVEAELDAMREVRLAPTNDRSVVGVMNEYALHGSFRWAASGATLEELALDLAGMPLGPLSKRTGFPDRELGAVLGIEPPPHGGRSRPTGPTAQRAAPPGTVLQLKVMLKGSKPPIWRRVLVDATSTLEELHEVIQAAFGWWNYHLYEFEFGRARYGIPDPDGFDFGPPTRDARTTRLDPVAGAGATFTYTYDFGDWWEHQVAVEKVLDASPVPSLPACLDGRRAGPPEDCGGVGGYQELLGILADPDHPEHASRAEWASARGGASLDPNVFDPADFAENLRTIHVTVFDD
ncbi:MAG: plasmid pRiA4b ORF-3 family protein [Acidimicrobiia bacterium]